MVINKFDNIKIMFEYSKDKVPISKLRFKIQKAWRHFWNEKALKKLHKAEGGRIVHIQFAKDAKIQEATEDLLSFYKYKDEAELLFIAK